MSSNRKKIVFVQTDESTTYDPVATFFAKKNQTTVSKPPVPKTNNLTKPMPNRTSVTKPTMAEKKEIEKEKPVTGKIGRKGQHLSYKKTDAMGKKQETIYDANSKKFIQSKQKIKSQANNLDPQQYSQIRQQSRNQYDKGSPVKLQPIDKKTNKSNNQEIGVLKEKIKKLQSNQAEYIRRLQQLQEKEQKFYKNQQKLNKLQKQHRLCGQQTKEMGKKLKQKQEQLKKLYSKDDIPYNKKRQILLINQLNNLKKTNRELVARIKNYKGNDLVEIAVQHNKSDILNQFDNGTTQQQNTDLTKVQSLAFRLVEQVQKYLTGKTSGKDYIWNEEKKFLGQITDISKQLSLQCLQHQFKVPQSNEQPLNLYDQIEKYRVQLDPLLSKHDLNLVITEENIQFINQQHQQNQSLVQTKKIAISNWVQSPKKFKKTSQASVYYLNKLKESIGVYETQFQIQNIILAHCLAQISFIQSWVAKVGNGLKQSLSNLHARMKEIEDIVGLGEMGKQSLFLYITENIKDLLIQVPQIQIKAKQIGAIFRNKGGKK